MADIAEASGVSLATVSLVLRDKPGIGPATRQKVLDSAVSLGYVASSYKTNERPFMTSIGLVFKVRPNDPPQSNQFYAPLLSGIEAYCRSQNINLLYAQLMVDEHNKPLEIPRLLKEQAADGLLFVGIQLDKEITSILKTKKQPIVLVDAYADEGEYDSVVSDNSTGAYQATTHLIENRHRHIAIVGSTADAFPSIQERRNGYLRALEENGLIPEFVDCEHSLEGAAERVKEFLRENERVTAVFCVNDKVAISVMQAAQALGMSIPKDLSIIGFDNIQLAHFVTPKLTTMRVDKMGMGRLAAQLLSNRIQFSEAGYVTSIIKPSLLERETVAKI